MAAAAYAEEELPTVDGKSRLAPSQPIPPGIQPSDPFSDDGSQTQEYGPAADCCDDYCCDDSCDMGCCTTCAPCESNCATDQFFFTADYLYLRSSFSDSVGFLDVSSDDGDTDAEVRQLEFDYESSFRIGGGYRLTGCGDEVRFLFTRLESSAELQQAGGDDSIFVPYLGEVANGFEALVDANVEIDSYELEYSKTIPLGGAGCGCECGDACGGGYGYGGCCGSCPAWDVRWSGGFRAADAEWEREYTRLNANDQVNATAESSMDFEGAGLKVGLEGRRYFCQGGWLSVYAKGDLSLLYGRLEFDAERELNIGTVDEDEDEQSTTVNQIVPVTDLEAGISGQISCYSRISAGYLLSAWHDLGFRDEIELSDSFPVRYDDANILGFDGFFARCEFAF
jgi:hypothetical protein